MLQWERMNTEGEEAFEAFSTYRDMGNQRSNAAVAQKLGKSIALMNRWSSAYEWVKRAAEWDREVDRQRRQAQLDEVKAMARRHAQMAQLHLTGMSLPAQALLRKMQKDPQAFNDALETMAAVDLVLLVRSMASGLQSVANIERVSRGEPTEIGAVRSGSDVWDNPLEDAILGDAESAKLASDLFRRATERVTEREAVGADDAGRARVARIKRQVASP